MTYTLVWCSWNRSSSSRILWFLTALNIPALCDDRRAPVPLFLGLFLCDGPRLNVSTPEEDVSDSATDVDPSCYPEHLSPACQGVLQPQKKNIETVGRWKSKCVVRKVCCFNVPCLYHQNKSHQSSLWVKAWDRSLQISDTNRLTDKISN